MILSQITKPLKTLPMWLMQTPRQVSFIFQILHQLHISISLFIKRSSHLFQILAGSSGGNNCIVLSHMIILELTSSHTCPDTLYTNTQSIYTLHTKFYTHRCTHTHPIFRICRWFQAWAYISILYFSMASWKILLIQQK